MSVIGPMVSRISRMIYVLWSVMSGIGTVTSRTWPVLSEIAPVMSGIGPAMSGIRPGPCRASPEFATDGSNSNTGREGHLLYENLG